MFNTSSHSQLLRCRSHRKTSLFAGPNSSSSNLNNVTVSRLDVAELTEGSTQAANSLTRLLDRIVKGTDELFLSPIANNLKPDEILSGWDRIYEANGSKINKVLDKIETSNRSKFGSRSKAKPWSERKETLYSSFGEGENYGGIQVPNLGVSGRLRPLTLEKAANYLKNGTNSGLPFMMRKSLVKDRAIELAQDYFGKYPACLFTRTQEGDKTRDIWGYSIVDTLVEMMFYRPLLTHQVRQPWRAALRTPRSLDEAINKLMSDNKETDQVLVSSDVSGFDGDCKKFLQGLAFNSFKMLYQPRYHDRIDQIANRFGNVPIVTPDGILSGPHGIPSGSTFTNEGGSTIQYAIYSSTRGVSMRSIQLQGDDSVCSAKDPDAVFRSFEEVGLRINVPKSDVSKEYCTYLQLLYHPDYRTTDGLVGGVYSTYRALNRIVHLERFDNISKEEISGKDYFAIRTISILENCKHHPLFKDLVKYIHSIDKYKLKISDLGIRQFVELKRRQEGKDVKFTNYTYGDDIEGIKSFETFKYLAELNV